MTTFAREPIPQMTALTKWIVEAKKAEVKIKNTDDIARLSVANAIQHSHLSMANLDIPGYSEATAFAATAAAHGSQAEHTLSTYSAPNCAWTHLLCLGCGSPHHFWSRPHDEKRTITCPKKDIPAVQENQKNICPFYELT